ncbi:MAG TPA: peroxiredoxin [Armatimonadota bacterium]|jgi:peroxiredoxin
MAIAVGANAPKLAIYSDSREVVNLPLPGEVAVLAFFPAAFTGVCTTEMCSFRDAMAQFNSLNAKVFGVSTDPPFTSAEFKKQNSLNFALLSDFNHEAIEAYGVEFPELAGIKGYTVARRSVFVIGKDGKIAWSWLSDTPANEPDYDAVKKAVEAASR